MKLKLKDETMLDVLDSSTATLIKMKFDSLEGMDAARIVLTKKNLASFQFTDEDGKVYGEFENHLLVNVSYREEAGKYLADFALRELSDTELRLDALEAGQETQAGAIEELAALVGGGE